MRQRAGSSLIFVMIFFSVLILMPRPPVAGQNQETTCLPFVQTVLNQVGENCATMGRNSACYGYTRIDSTFMEQVPADYFSKPADRADISSLSTIYTAPLSLDEQEWGITVMNLQANIPNTLPGQSVKFLLFGDVRLENAVQPEDIFTPMETPASISTYTAANIRRNPSLNSTVIVSVPQGSQLLTDAISGDHQWLRVTLEDNTIGWVNRDLVNIPSGIIDQIPVLTSKSRAPMQAIYLTTGLSDVNCNEAPPELVIQGPHDVTVNLSINGVNISLASTLIVRLTNNQSMNIVTLNGSVHVNDVSVPPGFSLTAPLSSDGKSLDGPLHDWRPLTSQELEQFASIPFIPESILSDPVTVPTVQEIQQTLSTIQSSGGSGGGGGRPSGEAAGTVQCGSFRLTSPLDGWAPQSTTFYWDAAPGATSYRLNINGGSAGSTETSSTNATYDLSGRSSDEGLSWSVDALYNGVTACTAGPVVIQHDHSVQAPAAACPISSSC